MILEGYFLEKFRDEFYKTIGKTPKSFIDDDLEIPTISHYKFHRKSLKTVKKIYKWLIQEITQFNKTTDDQLKQNLVIGFIEKIKPLVSISKEDINHFIKGKIFVESEYRKGTNFFVFLPSLKKTEFLQNR
ncbi:MAG: hypothetical protein CEE43_07990 [Promethearchaeota archaeon Loki_b32]|nr:MAG: hypothetical protein CEE43_07990 [Candidatus Lokiarchaeota archaeon Loki_b32]